MVITRFAPSPTGYLHVGGVRTALYNFLFARKNQGIFILRIEDTDKSRSKKEYENDIVDSLKWLNLKWDKFYKQSDRLKIYSDYLSELIASKKAFYCNHTKSELDIEREKLKSEGKPQVHWCNNKITTDPELLASNKSVIRLAVEQGRDIKFNDLIRGEIVINTDTIGDFVIAKNLNSPLYNFAAAIDDAQMNITHVIRGEEHISNTPKQILILDALGKSAPEFGHLPLILGQDRSKLSKRHGAASIKEFRQKGYLPEAMINFLVLLGWHPSSNRELFTLNELVREFSISRVQKSPAIFDIQKLNNLNAHYVKKLSNGEFIKLCSQYLQEAAHIDLDWLKVSGINLNKVFLLEKERIKILCDIINTVDFALKKDLNYDKNLLRWKEQTIDELKTILKEIKDNIALLENFDKISVQSILENLSRKYFDKGKIFWPLRVALSGREKSPGPAEIAEALGKNETIRRIEVALKKTE